MRQNTLWVLVGVGLLACAWEEDIAKDSDAIDDEAGFAVREACERVCGLENECGSGDRGLPFSSCDFSGEDYDCGSLDDCADACVQDTAAYLDQGEPCASNWMLVMNCLRSAPCDLLLVGMESPSELESVPECQGAESVDLASCDPLWPQVGCEGGMMGTSAAVSGECSVGFAACDEGDLGLSCRPAEAPDSGYVCQCLVNDEAVTPEFPDSAGCGSSTDDDQTLVRMVNVKCGWSIPDGTPQSAGAPVSCAVGTDGGTAGGAAVLDRDLGRYDRSDGAQYEVACTPAGDGYACNCAGGDDFHQVQIPGSTCPLQFDPAGAAHAANSICGWHLAEL